LKQAIALALVLVVATPFIYADAGGKDEGKTLRVELGGIRLLHDENLTIRFQANADLDQDQIINQTKTLRAQQELVSGATFRLPVDSTFSIFS
jgi:hypothetical protein